MDEIGNGWLTDRKDRKRKNERFFPSIFFLSFFYPFAILLRPILFPLISQCSALRSNGPYLHIMTRQTQSKFRELTLYGDIKIRYTYTYKLLPNFGPNRFKYAKH